MAFLGSLRYLVLPQLMVSDLYEVQCSMHENCNLPVCKICKNSVHKTCNYMLVSVVVDGY